MKERIPYTVVTHKMDPMCVDFLNSLWRDWRGSGRSEDRLDKPEWLDRFLSKWGLEVDDPNLPPGTP